MEEKGSSVVISIKCDTGSVLGVISEIEKKTWELFTLSNKLKNECMSTKETLPTIETVGNDD